MVCCWRSWRWMENMARCFAKVERKKNWPLAIRSLLCSCCMRVMAQMRSCYSTAFLQQSDATLPALCICSEDFWLLADPEKSFPHILLSATAWTDQHHVFRIPVAVSGSPCLDWHRTSLRGQQTVRLPSQSLWWSWCRQPPVWHFWRHLQGSELGSLHLWAGTHG